ncbi:hypothetical protein LTS08_005661 [Lithohypha guttulata]|uniref:uncharacterized protein n=1 Tax=Lithohypha guttulata TaxID=1690604 RepID=UPI002DDDD6B3|nr:hypothetical protein LTR51_003169 [Lithohypha guttulata]KAK5099946.1 hypothetical protein LTS08_005661 [Lithohypha guttulata]
MDIRSYKNSFKPSKCLLCNGGNVMLKETILVRCCYNKFHTHCLFRYIAKLQVQRIVEGDLSRDQAMELPRGMGCPLLACDQEFEIRHLQRWKNDFGVVWARIFERQVLVAVEVSTRSRDNRDPNVNTIEDQAPWPSSETKLPGYHDDDSPPPYPE